MESNYKKLGLSPNATKQQVEEQYIKLMRIYENQNVADTAQREFAEKSKKEITQAYNEIMRSYNKKSSSAFAYEYEEKPTKKSETAEEEPKTKEKNPYSSKSALYTDIRRLIQSNSFTEALELLEKYPFESDGEWNYLLGSALYFSGQVSKSYPYFDNAVRLSPNNSEYKAVLNRMKRAKDGKMYTPNSSSRPTYNQSSYDMNDCMCNLCLLDSMCDLCDCTTDLCLCDGICDSCNDCSSSLCSGSFWSLALCCLCCG